MARLLVIVAAACLLWQAMAFAGARVTLPEGHGADHALMHLQGTSHHHDAGTGDVRQDESPESTLHLFSDCNAFLATPLGALAVSARPLGAAALIPTVPRLVWTTRVGGIDRPPRQLA